MSYPNIFLEVLLFNILTDDSTEESNAERLNAARVARDRGEVTPVTVLCWFIENVQANNFYMEFFAPPLDSDEPSESLSLDELLSVDDETFAAYALNPFAHFDTPGASFNIPDLTRAYHLFNGEDCFAGVTADFDPSADFEASSFDELYDLFIVASVAVLSYYHPGNIGPWRKLIKDFVVRACEEFPERSKTFVAESLVPFMEHPQVSPPGTYFDINGEVIVFVSLAARPPSIADGGFADKLASLLLLKAAISVSDDRMLQVFTWNDICALEARVVTDLEHLPVRDGVDAVAAVKEIVALYNIVRPPVSVTDALAAYHNFMSQDDYFEKEAKTISALLLAVKSFTALN